MNEKSTIQKTASVHEKTVQAVAKHAARGGGLGIGAAGIKASRKPRRKSEPTATTHTDIKVSREVWAAAQQIIADKRNHYTHIEIRSDQEVIVR